MYAIRFMVVLSLSCRWFSWLKGNKERQRFDFSFSSVGLNESINLTNSLSLTFTPILHPIHAIAPMSLLRLLSPPLSRVVSSACIRRSLTARGGMSPSLSSSSSPTTSPLLLHRNFASKRPPSKPSKLVGPDLERELATLTGWNPSSKLDSIHKTWILEDFNQTFAVMTRVALLAEKMNHHPKWTNVYNHLKVELETHDLNGISDYVRTQLHNWTSKLFRPQLSQTEPSRPNNMWPPHSYQRCIRSR